MSYDVMVLPQLEKAKNNGFEFYREKQDKMTEESLFIHDSIFSVLPEAPKAGEPTFLDRERGGIQRACNSG